MFPLVEDCLHHFAAQSVAHELGQLYAVSPHNSLGNNLLFRPIELLVVIMFIFFKILIALIPDLFKVTNIGKLDFDVIFQFFIDEGDFRLLRGVN